jgi:hypothetical protein
MLCVVVVHTHLVEKETTTAIIVMTSSQPSDAPPARHCVWIDRKYGGYFHDMLRPTFFYRIIFLLLPDADEGGETNVKGLATRGNEGSARELIKSEGLKGSRNHIKKLLLLYVCTIIMATHECSALDTRMHGRDMYYRHRILYYYFYYN